MPVSSRLRLRVPVPFVSTIPRAIGRTVGLVVIGMSLLGASVPASSQPMPNAHHERLAERAAHRGTVRVVVGLNVDARAEGTLPVAALLQQRVKIRDAQRAAFSQLTMGTASRLKVNFDTIPYLALEVDHNALARLRNSPLVREIHEDHLAEKTLLQSVAQVNASKPYGVNRTGTGWAVAVLDTGVDSTHPMLAGKVVSEACYSTTSSVDGSQSLCPGGAATSTAAGAAAPCTGLCAHGTHVAAIAAGGPAPDGSSGVAKGANVVAVQIFSLFPNYYGAGQGAVLSYTSDQIKGLERVYALSSTMKIAAVNMSLGSGKYTATCDSSFAGLKTAIDNLRSVGIATVIASGNNGYRDGISGPACISSAVSVGATCDFANTANCATGINGVASFSNVASFLSLLAPGSSITSAVPGGGYAAMEGTSQAAPHVAGAWAILKQAQPTVSVTDALGQLRNNGVVTNDTRGSAVVTGMRRLDLTFLGNTTPMYTLSVAKAGTAAASGTVTSTVAGITCGADCTEPYASGTSVSLTAAAPAGTVFAGWSGACTGTATTCTVTMSADRAVTATFNAVMQTLTVVSAKSAATVSGTVASSPTGISCATPATAGSTTCSSTFAQGTSVVLTATPAAGSAFTGWSGACTGTATPCTVTVNAATSVTANFGVPTQTLSVTASKSLATAAGSVTSSPAGINCAAPAAVGSTTCSAAYAQGASVVLTATPAAGSVFTGWSGSCTGTATTCTVAMSAARSVTASFGLAAQTLSVTASRSATTASGTVTSSPAGVSCATPASTNTATSTVCSASFAGGTSVTLTAAAAAGSAFTGWSGGCTGTATTCTVSMTAARAVTATFGLPPQTLSVTVSKAKTTSVGTVTSSPAGVTCTTPTATGVTSTVCNGSFASGTSVTLTAAPGVGTTFSGWSGTCTGTALTCTVSMSAARSVTAAFN